MAGSGSTCRPLSRKPSQEAHQRGIPADGRQGEPEGTQDHHAIITRPATLPGHHNKRGKIRNATALMNARVARLTCRHSTPKIGLSFHQLRGVLRCSRNSKNLPCAKCCRSRHRYHHCGAFGKIITRSSPTSSCRRSGCCRKSGFQQPVHQPEQPGLRHLAAAQKPARLSSVTRFRNTMLDFTIVAFAIFLLVRAINRMKKAELRSTAGRRQKKNCW